MDTTGTNALAEALRQLEESHDRLLLSRTRLTMALERAELALTSLSTALLAADQRRGSAG